MSRFVILTVCLLAAAAPAAAESYYWGDIELGGNVYVAGFGDWGEVGFDRDDYYVFVDGFGDWLVIDGVGDIWVDGILWGYMDEFGDVFSDVEGFLFTIEYDSGADEFFHDGVFAFDPQTVFFVLAFEEKFFGWEVGLDEIFDFNQPPVASLSRERTGTVVKFRLDAVDLDGDIDAVLWDFGDGRTSTEFDPTHNYGQAGRFSVSVTVWDDGGESVTVFDEVRITRKPPKARFKKNKQKTVPGAVRFIDKSKDKDGVVVQWKWDFGDGETSTERFPTHVYRERGRYFITLTVWDNDGNSAVKTKGINIRFRNGR